MNNYMNINIETSGDDIRDEKLMLDDLLSLGEGEFFCCANVFVDCENGSLSIAFNGDLNFAFLFHRALTTVLSSICVKYVANNREWILKERTCVIPLMTFAIGILNGEITPKIEFAEFNINELRISDDEEGDKDFQFVEKVIETSKAFKEKYENSYYMKQAYKEFKNDINSNVSKYMN